MRNLFGSQGRSSDRAHTNTASRHSSGWGQLKKHLTSQESLRILDIGPTSAININYITSLGHSIYMANLVDEAAKPEWLISDDPSDKARFDVERFIAANLDFSERKFDVVIFWDTADYLPAILLAPVVERIHAVMQPGGLFLAFFHSKAMEGETRFSRYHLTATDCVEIQRAGDHALLNIYNNRQIEKLLHDFSGYKFFLAKDNLREVLAIR